MPGPSEEPGDSTKEVARPTPRAFYILICLFIFVSSRNVAIRKDVYDALNRERRPGESFTRLFDRLLHQRGPLEELVGGWGAGRPSAEGARFRRLRGIAHKSAP